jgi:AcrR family transcriptional regulator
MSSEMAKSRTYELKQRAERQQETRRRIVEAAVELHSTLGPARTTIADIAERAGVTRPTVYAHFPDARSLFAACSGSVQETSPPPDNAPWRAIADPDERLETALTELYGYYTRLESLLENVERDAVTMPVLAEIEAERRRHLAETRDLLVEGRPGGARTAHAIGHALEFGTWKSLVRGQGADTDEAVALMAAFVRAV